MRYAFVLAMLMATPALAQEPVGCDKFKWPLDKERALLSSAATVDNGGSIANPLDAGYRLALVPLAAAKLPHRPSRAPKDGANAGYVTAAAPPKSGTYRVTLSENAWIDVFQDGKDIKSGLFSGAGGCDGLRKSVKFDLTAAPFVIQLTGAAATAISLAVTAD